MKLFLGIILFLISTATAASAAGPSFKCKTAKRADEIAICHNVVLSDNDLETTRLFDLLRKTNRAQAIAISKALLNKRRACRSNMRCIGDAQTKAMTAYEQAMNYQVAPTNQVAQTIDTSNPWPDAYSRRSFKLGMTISQFRSTPYPDANQTPIYVVCSNEPRAQDFKYAAIQPNDAALRAAGVIGCGFFGDISISSGFSTTDEASVGLGFDTVYLIATHFYFIPDGSGNPRLFWIVTQGPSAEFPQLAQIMQTAYGTPQFHSEVLGSEVYSWTNSSSQIEFRHYGADINHFLLQHRLTALWGRISEIQDQQNREAAKRL